MDAFYKSALQLYPKGFIPSHLATGANGDRASRVATLHLRHKKRLVSLFVNGRNPSKAIYISEFSGT